MSELMVSSKENAKENLAKLVQKFEKESASGLINEYNEEETKKSFIEPLLKDVLGWNVNDRDEVSVEETISRGRVDYALKLEGSIKLFVEAKKPKDDLVRFIEQAVGYGYSHRGGVGFVLLTNFKELKLFDVTIKPDLRNPLKGLKISLSWNQYLTNLDKLWLLSKESVSQGELDKLLLIKPKARSLIENKTKELLEDIKRWKEILAKDIFKNNPELFHTGDLEKDSNYLKEITQKILDRIIFIRFCEDRGLLQPPTLKELFEERTEVVGTNTMIFLKEKFKHCNIIFDSDLFRPQEWENKIKIDFRIVKQIIWDTYYPYLFDVIPLEFLGNIYEQYLGYSIRLTDHLVKYELKPELSKAEGVYYTPEYIVDYIVKNTVGKLLQELPFNKIKKLRILDPACGSGSFLIRAYEEMLNWYKRQKKQNSPLRKEQNKLGLKYKETTPELTIQEKSMILREHIYGVDIDEQAVEVTKLSLMLKMLEDEYGIVPGRALLPMLDQNIKCGNSLISGSATELKASFGDDWYRVKPFNWDEKFRKVVVEEGGFDVVIGNPPYVKEYTSREPFEYLKGSKLRKYYEGKMDLWYAFTCLALDLLKPNGLHSFIATNNWITAAGASILRNKILSESKMIKFIDFYDFKVFEKASIQTMIFILKKQQPAKKYLMEYRKILDKNIPINELSEILNTDIKKLDKIRKEACEYFMAGITPSELKNTTLTFVKKEFSDIIGKINEKTNYKFNEKEVAQGIVVPQDFVVDGHLNILRDKTIKKGDGIFVLSNEELKRLRLSKEELKIIKPYYTTEELKRYYGNRKNRYWIIYTDLETRKNINRYPKIKKHLDKFKDIITSDFAPYGLHRAREQHFFEGEKIISLRITPIPCFTYTDFPCYVSQTFFIIQPRDINLKYLTAILNSKVIAFWFSQKGKKQGHLLQIDKKPLMNLPLIKTQDQKIRDKIIALVEIMLDLSEKIQGARGGEKEQIQDQLEKAEQEIDNLVYQLYGITEREKKIIEGK